MDNCSVHVNQSSKELCNNCGVKVLYLPPYSPDYNPIEEFFSVLKVKLKRHNSLLTIVNFKDYLVQAIEACCDPNTTKAHFSHSEYLKRDAGGEAIDESDSEWDL